MRGRRSEAGFRGGLKGYASKGEVCPHGIVDSSLVEQKLIEQRRLVKFIEMETITYGLIYR